MELKKILQMTENIKSKFNCEHCIKPCTTPHRIKQCGHIYCKSCVILLNTCFKCGIIFVFDDVFVDNALIKILKSINIVTSEIENNSVDTSSTLCNVVQSEQNKSNNTLHSNIIEDKYFNCNCSNCFEVKQQISLTDNNDKKNAVGETKLHRACKKNMKEEVKHLLNSDACVNAQDYAGWTALHEAVIVGNVEIIQWLIEKGSIVNAPGFNYDTPLHKAIIHRNVEIARILIHSGADRYSINYEGNSPWDLANSDMRIALNDVKQGSISNQRAIRPVKLNLFILGQQTEELIMNINKFSKFLSVNIMNEINEHVTLVICNQTSKIVRPSYQLLLAILHCIPVVTSEWFNACVTLRKLVDCDEYFIIGTDEYQNDVIRTSQINKYKLNPKLFSGCHIVLSKTCDRYLLNDKECLSVSQMRQLITVGGGTLLKREPIPGAINGICRPWHTSNDSSIRECAHYILYDPVVEPPLRYNMRELKHVPYYWLFESILRYQLVAPENLYKTR